MFQITLTIELCIDDNCESIPVLNDLNVPIPFCNTDFTNFQLPGDGTIAGFVQHLAGDIGDAGINLVIQKLGISVSK